MAIEKFVKIVSGGIPLKIENVDTDQIIPARFLKATERKGFGENLFRDWRFDKQGNKIDTFPLNDPKYSGEILFAGKNFGSGSSREHAAWAIYDYGLRVVVSSAFADIFRNNALNCGLLPLIVSEKYLENAFKTIANNASAKFEVDLANQTITNIETGEKSAFEIDQYKKECLLNGYDDIDFLRSIEQDIKEFEKKNR